MSKTTTDEAKLSLPGSWENIPDKMEIDRIVNDLNEAISNGDEILDGKITTEKERAEGKETELNNKFNSYTPTIDIPDIKVDNAAEADHALKATQDNLGNVINNTYARQDNTYTMAQVDEKVSAVYKYKGSVANEAALPMEGNTVGDVYDVRDTGLNYAWDGDRWDSLGGQIDLSIFPTRDEIPGIRVDNAVNADEFNNKTYEQTKIDILKGKSDAAVLSDRAKTLTCPGDGNNLYNVLNATSILDLGQKLKALSDTHDYSKLGISDYISIPQLVVNGIGTLQNTSGNLDFEIAAFDHYKGVGSTDSGPGILFVARNCCFRHRMNATNTNEGGYNAAELKGILNTDFAAALEAALGVQLKTVYRYVDTHGSYVNAAEKCFLPTEVEIFGHQVWGRGGYYTGTSVQYPIYSINPQKRCKKYNGSRQWYWEGTSRSDSTASFCGCGSSGFAVSGSASDAHDGVSPAFYL